MEQEGPILLPLLSSPLLPPPPFSSSDYGSEALLSIVFSFATRTRDSRAEDRSDPRSATLRRARARARARGEAGGGEEQCERIDRARAIEAERAKGKKAGEAI